MKETIWIAGAEGRLGSELLRLLKKNSDNKIMETDTDVDITDLDVVNQAMDLYQPTIVINCVSLSDVVYCEEHLVEAYKVNALGARNLAIASRRKNAKIIHLSTDDIFEGNVSGYHTEFDTPNPKTIYGKSKLAGENYVRELNPKHLIVRSSWVYGAQSAKGDYFSYVVNCGKTGQVFEAPVDKISTPTSARELARFIKFLMSRNEYGIYHASCEGKCSRYEFAKSILEEMGYDASLVQGISSEHEGGQNSTLLENLMLKMTELYSMPAWEQALSAYVQEIKAE